MKRILIVSLILAPLLAGCNDGESNLVCVSGHTEPRWYQPPPLIVSTGKVTSVIPQIGYYRDEFICDEYATLTPAT